MNKFWPTLAISIFCLLTMAFGYYFAGFGSFFLTVPTLTILTTIGITRYSKPKERTKEWYIH